MCLHGIYRWVDVINPDQNRKRVKVDACIADEIQWLNDQGIITLGCCCGHGKAGFIYEVENAYGKWKGHREPPQVSIKEQCVEKSKELGYRPIPYFYADGGYHGSYTMYLKTGCITMDEVKEWHEKNNLPFEKDLGVIAGSKTPCP